MTMETHIDSGDAGYALQLNSIIQAQSRTAYWISGGDLTPGTSSTNVTVAVETGDARINDTDVSWSAEELQLADGGVGPSGTDTGNPRVDVIFAKQNGTLGVAVGEPEPYAPDTDASGNPMTPPPFSHWEPSPNGGGGVGGVPLGFVLVEPDDAVAADIASGDIKIWHLSAAGGDRFVRGDGTDNGAVEIETGGNPFTIEEDGVPWFEHDPANGDLILGSADAQPTLDGGKGFDTNGERFIFDSGASPFRLVDENDNTDVFSAGSQGVNFRRDLNMQGNTVNNFGSLVADDGASPVLDLTNDPDGSRAVWRHTDGSGVEYIGQSNPGGGDVFTLRDVTNNVTKFRVGENGNTYHNGGNVSEVNAVNFQTPDGAKTDLTTNSEGDLIYFDEGGSLHKIVDVTA